MTLHPRALTATAVVGLLLTGCTSDQEPTASQSPGASASASASATASASASASPTSTLSAAKQRAVEQAAEAVRAYEQTIVDVLADPEPYLNSMNDVAAQPQLEIELRNLQQLVVAGETVIQSSGPVAIASVDPVKVDIKGDPPTVTLLVCVDSTATSGTYKGKPWTGPRQLTQYRVIKTTYLPDPGWAVSKVLPPKGFDQPQPC